MKSCKRGGKIDTRDMWKLGTSKGRFGKQCAEVICAIIWCVLQSSDE